MVEQMADKELEEQLMEAGTKLLQLPSEVDELLCLLDQIECCLSKVEQSPSKSMQNALSPSMKALVASDLLGHKDTNVKVSVAACVSEITRITAPDAPYSDDEMKQIFQLIVGSFEMLWDTSSRSYAKRVSILETVAKVRSCVVMLDLECDGLILEMFQHFLKTIQDYHPTNVYTSMETILSLVLEESEEISPELLYPLLTTVKKDNQDILPIARKLGEKVLESCTSKLKPYLLNAVKSMGTSPNDYSTIVASICQDASDTKEHNNDTVSKERLDDGNSHKKMESDTPPQTTQERKPEAACPVEVDEVTEKSKQFTASNGDAQNNKYDNSSPKNVQSSHPVPQPALVEPDRSNHKLAEAEDKTDQTSQKNRGQNPDVSPDIDESRDFLSQEKSRNDKSPCEDQSTDKTVSPPKPEKESVEEVPLITSRDEPVKVASASPSLSLSDRGNSKRGRPARTKKGAAKEDDTSLSEDQSIDKPVSPSGPEKEIVEEPPLPTSSDEPVKVVPPPSLIVADKSRSKRGRPARPKKGITKDDDNMLLEGQSMDKLVSPSEHEKEDTVDDPLLTTSQDEPVKVASPSPCQSLADRGHSKRGRPPGRTKKGTANEDDNSLSEGQSFNKPVSPSGAENEAVEEVPLPTTSQDKLVKVPSPSPSQSLADKSRPKRGRPARSKKGKTNKGTDHCSPSVPKGKPLIEQVESEAPPELEEKPTRNLGKKGLVNKESDEEKVSDASSDSEETSNKHSGKKRQFDKETEEEKGSEATSDSEEKPLKRSRKKVDVKNSNNDVSSAKKQVQKTKKGNNSSPIEKEQPEKSSNKKTISTSKSAEKSISKNQKLSEETPRTTSKRKRTPAKEETSERSSGEDFGKNLVGSKIKVWWPDDEMFYEGMVESFDPATKKHKVSYVDGDEEILTLKEERWEHIDEFSVLDGGQATDLSSPNASSEMPEKKKAKTGLGSASKHAKMDTSLKKGKQSSTSKFKDEGTTSHPKSKVDKTLEDTPKAVSSLKSSKSKGNTPKSGSKAKDDTPKSKDETPKISTKSKVDAQETGSKDATPKTVSKSKDTLKLGSKTKEETSKSEMKSEDDTAKTKTKSKSVTPKTGNKSGASESSAKGKLDTSKVQETETKSGKKRRR